jgi:hypothetical protein
MTMSAYGFPVDSFDLRCIIKSYLDKNGVRHPLFCNNFPGIDWVKSFIKRHRDLSERFASNISKKRAQVGEENINEYFNHLESELENVPNENVWNYDETNLTDDQGQKRVITKRGSKYPERIMNATKSAVSLMFCGSADGEMLPPYVVYKSESMWSTWTEGGPTGTRYNRSKSGWFDSSCFEDWFNTLVLPRLRKQDGKKVLVGDNLSSHINESVIKKCEEENIAFISLVPNSTHLTQPLDIAYFHPMKVAWRKILTDFKQSKKGANCGALPKDLFPKLLKKLMDSLLENGKENMKSGFRKAGICPLDRDQVLHRIPTNETTDMDVSLSDSFTEYLKEMRGGDMNVQKQRRKKVNVTPGKSVSADDFPCNTVNATRTAEESETELDTLSSDEETDMDTDLEKENEAPASFPRKDVILFTFLNLKIYM